MKKILFSMFLLVFALCLVGCTKEIYKLTPGTYTFECQKYYAEIKVSEINEIQYNESNGMNVVKIDEDNKYYVLDFYIVYSDTNDKIKLNFCNLKTEKVNKISFSNYYFCNDNSMIVVKKDKINISYTLEEISVNGDFKLEN